MVVDLVMGAVFSRFLLTARVTPPLPDFVERMIDTLWRGLARPSRITFLMRAIDVIGWEWLLS